MTYSKSKADKALEELKRIKRDFRIVSLYLKELKTQEEIATILNIDIITVNDVVKKSKADSIRR